MGFPLWVRYCHFFNFFFVMLLIRSGLSILVDHPRLYFNDDCTPGSEWIRFTPLKVPRDRIWTAKDDARYISPLVSDTRLPSHHRHCAGLALHQRSRIHHHGYFLRHHALRYRAVAAAWYRLRRSYFSKHGIPGYTTRRFICLRSRTGFMATTRCSRLRISRSSLSSALWPSLTGIAMSPAVVNRFPWYAQIFGGRQSARSIHFLTMLSFLAFLVVHVTLVVMTGFARNMNHIVMGTDDQGHLGMYSGVCGNRRGCSLVDRGALHLVASPARAAARA